MDKYKYSVSGGELKKKDSIFITEKNINKISFRNEGVKTLVEIMEKTKPEIFEEKLDLNQKNNAINKIEINRLVKSNETAKAGVKKYSLKELKQIVAELKINVSIKKSDEFIDAIRKVIFNEEDDEDE